MSHLTHLIHSLHVTHPADLIPLLKGLVLYYWQQAIKLERQKEFLTYWPFCLFCSLCCCCAPSCIPCLLQKCFYSFSWFYKYYKLQTSCVFITHVYGISPVCYCCTKWSYGISAHFWFSFSCLCVVKKWVQTYYHSILFLHFTSVCHYFLGNTKNSPSSEVNCWSSWFNCFSLLLLWSLQCSLPRIFFYVPLFHCTWSFLVIHSWLILYLNVLDWAMHWKSRGIWYYVVSLSEISFEKLKYPNLLKYSLPCWGWNDRFSTITYIFPF